MFKFLFIFDYDNIFYIGGEGADNFVCGDGIDTITDFNAAEGDTKTAGCENVLEASESALNNNNATTTESTISSPSSGETVGDFPPAEEEETSSPPSATTTSSDSATETRGEIGTTAETQTTEVLPDEEPA